LTERLYEGLFLLDSNEAAKGWSELEGHITGLLDKHEARVEHAERWPDQRLATEVQGVKKGTYFLTFFRAPAEGIVGLRRDVELSDRILRFLVTRETFTEDEMIRRREQARRRAEHPAPQAAAAAAAERPDPDRGGQARDRSDDDSRDDDDDPRDDVELEGAEQGAWDEDVSEDGVSEDGASEDGVSEDGVSAGDGTLGDAAEETDEEKPSGD
jgi:small subunit ribosomal protein S6